MTHDEEMGKSIVPFDFDGEAVRVHIDERGEPWFVAADVARLLGYANPRDAVAKHCKGVAKRDIPTAGGIQVFTILPERDVYRLIMRSRLPSAERFEEWVVGEVLPSVRKTGSYGAPDPLATLADPAQLRTLLLGYTEKVLALEAANAELAPKAQVYDDIVDASGTLGFREACKVLRRSTGVTEDEVRLVLFERRCVQRVGKKMLPTYIGEQRGYVTTRMRRVPYGDGSVGAKPELRVTPKGVTWLARLLRPEAA